MKVSTTLSLIALLVTTTLSQLVPQSTQSNLPEPTQTPAPLSATNEAISADPTVIPSGTLATVSQRPLTSPQLTSTPQSPAPPQSVTSPSNSSSTLQSPTAAPTPEEKPHSEPDTRNVFEKLSASSEHKVFVDIIRKASLTDYFRTTSNITVLAPTNEGFVTTLRDFRYKNDRDPDAVSQFWSLLFDTQKDKFNITRIVLYHVLSPQLTQEQIQSKGTSNIETKSDDVVELKQSQVQDIAKSLPNPDFTSPLDMQASNGIVHSLNRVLLPTDIDRDAVTTKVVAMDKTFTPVRVNKCDTKAQATSMSSKAKSVFEYFVSSPNHRVFDDMIRKAGLIDFFLKAKGITVFAPTDAAFLTTLRDFRYKGESNNVLAIWSRMFNNRDFNLTRIVLYHVTPQQLTASQLECMGSSFAQHLVKTASGDIIELSKGMLQDKAKSLPNPKLTKPLDVQAPNGIVHSLNRVLFPIVIDREVLTKQLEQLEDNNGEESPKACFPLSATVRTAEGDIVHMRDLDAGHLVHVSEAGDASAVFLFTHRTTEGEYNFVRLATRSGHAITLSEGHYIYANGRLTAASAVRVGDVLRTMKGPSRVISVVNVREQGLVAPHTMHGDIVVDDIVASSYTTAVHPTLAQMMLAPMRAVVRLGLAKEPLGAVLYNGADRIVQFLPAGPKLY